MSADNDIRLHLIGKKYIDMLLYMGTLELSATNEIKNVHEDLGGIYNIKNLEGIMPIYSPVGQKRAIIISESDRSRRTSIVQNVKKSDLLDTYNLCKNLVSKTDWTHVAYIDDVTLPEALEFDSVDFCTNNDRHSFRKQINKCTLIFDSRERRELYENTDLNSLIILHDPYGCEAIFKDFMVYDYQMEKTDGIHTNGAGDIFAGIFIREFFNNGLQTAVESSCEITTSLLKQRQENEKI
tara:strand:+ start:281 stop:997 length:717 start_codon:yes stop_codon:yes gene_type:complete